MMHEPLTGQPAGPQPEGITQAEGLTPTGYQAW